MKGQLIVTSYEYPDLDGTACAYAYSEFLNKTGSSAKPMLFKTPNPEAIFVMKLLGLKVKGRYRSLSKSSVILVDSSDPNGIARGIDPKNVLEVIDHRKVNEAEKFPNAKVQIEFVGAAATLIAERFYYHKIKISEEAALLLYSAIISNTINFRASVTTGRDRKMASWLKSGITLPSDYIHNMFLSKSVLKEPLYGLLDQHTAEFSFSGKKLGIIQLEMIGVDDFVGSNIERIRRCMSILRHRQKFDYLLFTLIDVEKYFNRIICIDDKTRSLVKAALGVKFNGDLARVNSVIMRKEMVPKLKELFA